MKESLSGTQVEIPKIPTLAAQKERIIPYGTNILINDIGADENWKDECRRLLQPNLQFLAPHELSGNLEIALKRIREGLAESKVAVLYPERGGIEVQKSLDLGSVLQKVEYQEFRVGSTRYSPGTPPIIVLTQSLVDSLKQRTYNTILVVDDVIVTGETLKAVQNQICFETDEVNDTEYNQSLRFSWSEVELKRLPLNWYAASWLTSAKPKTQKPTLSEYRRVLTGLYYKGEKGLTPVNSISTWVFDETKGQQILEAYAQKYAQDPQVFCEFIAELKLKGGEK